MIAAGDKALLLLPVWLMGVALQRSGSLRIFSSYFNVTIALAAVPVFMWLSGQYFVARSITTYIAGPWIVQQLAGAGVFWLDWALGASMMMHLAGICVVSNRMPLEWIEKPVRWCAGISFAAYLIHMPMLRFCAAFLPKDQGLLAIALTSLVIATLGREMERSKDGWRRILNYGVDAFLRLIAPPAASADAPSLK